MKKRSYDPEIIDLGPDFYTTYEYNTCLQQLGRIGSFLGGNTATFKAFKQVTGPIDSILDVGCGGGSFTTKLAQEFPHARVVGIDVAPYAINYAQEQLITLKQPISNIQFELRTTPALSEPEKSFDVVTATLVCHHLDDITLIDFFKRARVIAKKAIIINDLHRHWVAYHGAKVIMPLFFRNRLVQNDSLLSIKKSFTHADLVDYLTQAGFSSKQYTIHWHWLFRWVITVDTSV